MLVLLLQADMHQQALGMHASCRVCGCSVPLHAAATSHTLSVSHQATGTASQEHHCII